MAAELEQTLKLLKDPVITDYIDRLGQNLVRHSDAKVYFHFRVVDTEDADVTALPGGFIYVDKGLIVEAGSESELAGIMAHGVAHVCARHATRKQSIKQYLQLSNPTVSAGEPLELLGITREFEREADQLDIQYLWNTGYNPNAFVSLLKKMQAGEKSKPGHSAAFFRTHPSTADRMARCLEEQRALPEKDSYIVSSPEFDRAKARLLADR